MDLSAYLKHGNSIVLSKTERQEAAGILHNLCVINNKKMTILSAIDIMCESLKRYYKSYSELEIHLPEVIAVEKMESHIREKTCLHGCLFHFQHLPC